jgi:hypothetical protein
MLDTTLLLTPRPPAAEPPPPKLTLVILLAVCLVAALAASFILAFPRGAGSAPTEPRPDTDRIADSDPIGDCPTAGH